MHVSVQNLLRSVVETVEKNWVTSSGLSMKQDAVNVASRIKAFFIWLAEHGHLRDFQIYRGDQMKALTVHHEVKEGELATVEFPPDSTPVYKLTVSVVGTPLHEWEPYEFIYPCEICHAYGSEGGPAKPIKTCPLCRGTAKRTALNPELEHELIRIEERLLFLTNFQSTYKWETEQPVIHSSERPDHALVVAIEQLTGKLKAIQTELDWRKGICAPGGALKDLDKLYDEFNNVRIKRLYCKHGAPEGACTHLDCPHGITPARGKVKFGGADPYDPKAR